MAALIALLTVAFIVFYAVESSKYTVGRKTYRSLPILQADLARRTGLAGQVAEFGWWQGLSAVRLAGRLATGREARVEFFQRSAGKSSISCVRFSVAADPDLRLSVARESLLTPLAKWLGFTHDVDSGDPRFDERYVVESSGPERARLAYARGLKDAIEAAFRDHGVDSFEAKGGWLTVTTRASHVSPEDFERLLWQLAAAAASFDRVAITVHALGGRRMALKGASGLARCAYCHADVTGEEPDLVACERCKTVLHGECWSELGHCPLLGCTGRAPERSRVG